MDDAPNRAQHPGPCWPGWRGLLPFIGWGTAVGLVFFAEIGGGDCADERGDVHTADLRKGFST